MVGQVTRLLVVEHRPERRWIGFVDLDPPEHLE